MLNVFPRKWIHMFDDVGVCFNTTFNMFFLNGNMWFHKNVSHVLALRHVPLFFR
jgi:hypothetical protein